LRIASFHLPFPLPLRRCAVWACERSCSRP
jgi:hypothetical protein